MASDSGGRIVPPAVPMTITQIAVVVADIKSALRSYTENLGWGPWSCCCRWSSASLTSTT
jgi:hypothetical protein